MKKSKIPKIGAVGITILFIASVLALPMSGATNVTRNVAEHPLYEDEGEPVLLDTIYAPEEEILFVGDQNDIGYNTDAGKVIFKSFPVYVGEPVDQSVPGRGRIGTLEPDGGDSDDWYMIGISFLPVKVRAFKHL
jgi:hypothetical protein